jgi:hypothetical protein
MACLLLVTVLTAQAASAAVSPPSYTGTAIIDNGGFYAATSLPAASTVAGNYQYAFVDYTGTENYSGAPSGWAQVCMAKGAASIATFVHLNGSNEPSSNSWGIGGTSGGVYAMTIGAVTNTAGVDGSVCDAPGDGAPTITADTPNIRSSGASDFTATWATVSGSAGSLIFSGPSNFSVWAPGANAAEGYYYTGVPVAVTYANGSGTPHFSPLAAQIAFLSSGAAATPIPTGVATPTPAATPTSIAPVVDENFLAMGGVLDARIDFARLSAATVVGSNGLIQSVATNSPRFDYDPVTGALNGLLLEQGSTNQQLDSSFNIFPTGINRWYTQFALLDFNSAIAADGTQTTATLADNSTDSSHGAFYANGAIPVGLNPGIPFFDWPVGGPQIETCSMFFKAGSLDFAQLRLFENASSAGATVDIDLSAGKLANGGTIGNGSTYLGSAIQANSGGSYRVSVSADIPNPHNLSCIPFAESSLGNFSYTGNGGTISVWGGDIENSEIPTSYLYTASVSNLQLDSDNFGNWDSGGGATTECGNHVQCNSALTLNAATAPDGSNTAAQLADNATNGNHLTNHGFGLGGAGVIPTIGQYYATVTCSAFFKQGTQQYAQLQCGTGGSSFVNGEANSGISVDIDLQNGTIANGGTYGVSGSDQTSYIGSSIEGPPNAQFPNAPPGWYRVSVTGVIIVEADVHIQLLLEQSLGTNSYPGTGSTIFIWGPQVEQHEDPALTEYVPVGEIPAGAVTRAPEVATEALAGSGLNLPIFANGLSWVISGITPPGNTTDPQVAAELDDGTAENAITLERISNGHLEFLVVSGGVTEATLDLGPVPNHAAFRVGVNAGLSSFTASIGGGPLISGAGAMPATLTTARYGADTLGDYWNGWLRESGIWGPTPLSNAQLQAASAKAP